MERLWKQGRMGKREHGKTKVKRNKEREGKSRKEEKGQ